MKKIGEDSEKKGLALFSRAALGVVAAVLFAAALTFSIFLICNKTDGFYTFFSQKGYVAEDDLMSGGENFDSFRKGEMVLFATDVDFERSIAKGQVVLFRKTADGVTSVGARRVDSVVVKKLPSGATVTTYRVKADNSEELLTFDVAPNEIFGVFSGVSASLGKFFTFLNQFTGYIVLIVLPALFGAAAAIILLFSYLKKRG